jgi:hypothetical protein
MHDAQYVMTVNTAPEIQIQPKPEIWEFMYKHNHTKFKSQPLLL